MQSPLPYRILSNGMGTGKTNPFFNLIKLRSILCERKLAELNDDSEWAALSDEEKLQPESFQAFRPSLHLGPNAAKLNPATGRTVIVSTYRTIPKRWLGKESELFQFTPEPEKGQAQKKKKGNKKRLRKYTSLDDDEYTTLEKGQCAKAGGGLVTYLLRDKCTKEYEFNLIILDEAQYLRRTSGSYDFSIGEACCFSLGHRSQDPFRGLLSPLTLIAHTNPITEGLSKQPSIAKYIPGLYLEDRNPLEDGFEVVEGGRVLGETRGIFSGTLWKELEEQVLSTRSFCSPSGNSTRWKRISDIPKPWFSSPDLLQATAKELTWSVNLGSKFVRPLLNVLYTQRKMNTELIPPDGINYFEDGPYGIIIHDQGTLYGQSSYSIRDDTKVHMNFGAHRAGVISAFDPRTVKMLDNETPAFYGDKRELVNRFATLVDEITMTQSREKNAKKSQSGAEIVGLGVEHIELLLCKTDNGGLHYVRYMSVWTTFPTFNLGFSTLPSLAFPSSQESRCTQEQLADKLKALRSKEAMKDPETGRIIVFSTYPTLSARWPATDREPFVWADDVETPTKTIERTKKQRIRSYTKETIDTGKITKLPKGDTREGCDGELVNYHLSKPAVEKFEFGILICDEAQFMRRASGSYSNLVRLIKWEKLLFVTGTPMASSLRDVLSPLTLIRHINPLILAFQGLCLLPVRTFLGRLPSLFYSGYSTTIEFNKIERSRRCRGIYHDTFMEFIQTGKADAGNAADPVLFDALVHWKAVHYSSGTAVKPWLLSADVLRAGASLLGWGVDFGS
ncbi:unnamed protein product [Fusarium equiseti]|uniref:Helicase ATP-binding domain-containing protein n=1 Tax=Fusarium equiseti TaxID=61235 RepID=A0A8J2J0U9_FUSEQ|nr:unnamed protein product [Fusarium equiseti]